MIKPAARLIVFLCGFLAVAACDPAPTKKYVPPGGFAAQTDETGVVAIRAVLVTPSHGTFLTVREALSSYIGRADQHVKVKGWSAARDTTSPVPHYNVAFAWNDGEQNRQAEWELNKWGIWPLNNEARILSVFPPEDGN
jgi:hypothetical protein